MTESNPDLLRQHYNFRGSLLLSLILPGHFLDSPEFPSTYFFCRCSIRSTQQPATTLTLTGYRRRISRTPGPMSPPSSYTMTVRYGTVRYIPYVPTALTTTVRRPIYSAKPSLHPGLQSRSRPFFGSSGAVELLWLRLRSRLRAKLKKAFETVESMKKVGNYLCR